MNQRLQQAEHGEENRRWESPLVQPLTDYANERHHYDTHITLVLSDTVSRYGTSTERAWWQEQINGPRGVRLSAALSFGLLHALYALAGPVSVLLTYLPTQNLPGGTTYYTIISLATSLLVAVATGFIIRRIAPRNAVAGTAIAAAIEVGITVLRWVIYYWHWCSVGPPSQVWLHTPFWQVVVLPVMPVLIMVLTVLALAKYDRYKRSRER